MPSDAPKPDTTGSCRYPSIKVRLTGTDGNAFVILGKVSRAMKKVGIGKEEIDLFYKQATSGNYDHLLMTCMKWVEVR